MNHLLVRRSILVASFAVTTCTRAIVADVLLFPNEIALGTAVISSRFGTSLHNTGQVRDNKKHKVCRHKKSIKCVRSKTVANYTDLGLPISVCFSMFVGHFCPRSDVVTNFAFLHDVKEVRQSPLRQFM